MRAFACVLVCFGGRARARSLSQQRLAAGAGSAVLLLLLILDAALQHYRAHEQREDFDLFYPFEITANLGIACYHSLQINQGLPLLKAQISELQALQLPIRDVRWTNLAVRLGGTLRWLYLGAGELELGSESWTCP